MHSKNDDKTERIGAATAPHRVGFYAAILTTALTLVTFGLAIIAVPISGANCQKGCIEYPYLNTLEQFPRDYLWMPPAILLLLAYIALMTSIHTYAAPHTKAISQIGLSCSIVAASILASDYFVQFSVVPASLARGESEGITLLTQYNPHGIFIALEELGYVIMSLSFLFIAPVFDEEDGLEMAVRWIFIAGFALTMIALAVITSRYGLDRQDRFEVAVIAIDWLVLMLNGALVSVVFRRRLDTQSGGWHVSIDHSVA